MLPPLEGLTARRRLCSRLPVRAVTVGGGTASRSASALRFSGLPASFLTGLLLVRAAAVLVTLPAAALASGRCFGREIWVIRGDDELDEA